MLLIAKNDIILRFLQKDKSILLVEGLLTHSPIELLALLRGNASFDPLYFPSWVALGLNNEQANIKVAQYNV